MDQASSSKIQMNFLTKYGFLISGSLLLMSSVISIVATSIWTSGEYVFNSQESCNESINLTTPCQVSLVFGPLPITLMAISFLLLLIHLFKEKLALAIANRKLTKSIEVSKFENLQKEINASSSKNEHHAAEPKNTSLRNMAIGTSLLIASGISLGVISIVLLANSDSKFYFFDSAQKVQDLTIAGVWGQISEWLLAVGILGKLLIGAAKIIVEGLGGNIRSDKD